MEEAMRPFGSDHDEPFQAVAGYEIDYRCTAG